MSKFKRVLPAGKILTSSVGEDSTSNVDEQVLRSLAGSNSPGSSATRVDRELPKRVIVGFIAGFFSVLIFSNGMIAIFHAAGIVPFEPWDMVLVPPFGVPKSLSAAFFGGLWGGAYALMETRFTERLGWWAGGLVFGAVLPMLVDWFVVMSLKSMPIGYSFVQSRAVFVSVALHTFFGLGTAIIFLLGLQLVDRSRSRSITAS